MKPYDVKLPKEIAASLTESLKEKDDLLKESQMRLDLLGKSIDKQVFTILSMSGYETKIKKNVQVKVKDDGETYLLVTFPPEGPDKG